MKCYFSLKKFRNDIILGIGLLLAALCLWLFTEFGRADNNRRAVVRITCQNEILYEGSLSENSTIYVKNNEGKITNIVEISDGHAVMYEADCPDKLCINQGRISKIGQTIICLPNKVMVTLIGVDSQYDGISQ